MSPRPLYRWKSFWFGLLVSSFMGWAWLDSIRYVTTAINGPMTLVRNRATTYVMVDRFSWDPWTLVRVPDDPSTTPVGPEWERYRRDAGLPCVKVPDVAIFFPFLVGWIGWLGWRIRRHRAAAGVVGGLL